MHSTQQWSTRRTARAAWLATGATIMVVSVSGCGGDSVMDPPAATGLAFRVQPANATAGTPFAPALEVEIRDATGTRVTTAGHAVTLALASAGGGATLAGTTTVNAVAGVASFANLSIDMAGEDYALAASSNALAGATSGSFSITAAAPARLAFVVQPTTAEGMQAIAPSVQVEVRDAFDNFVPGAADVVTLALGSNQNQATLTGTTTTSASDGIATFPDLRIDRPGADYTLVASSGELVEATSAPFGISLTFAKVSAGTGHTCGVTTTRVAYCWGGNGSGQLGDGTTTFAPSPVAVAGGLHFASVDAGNGTTCGVTTAGAAYCWGGNTDGQLGDGSTSDRSSPVAVGGGLTFAMVSAGVQTCGVTTGGAAYCWGSNVSGSLGDGTNIGRTSPSAVLGGLSFAAVSAGHLHTCGISAAGEAFCWGYNVFEQLGDGTSTDSNTPVAVLGELTFAAVEAGGLFSCGVTTGNAAYCWGHNAQGQLGDGSTSDRSSPVAVGGGPPFALAAAGGSHACAVAPSGAASCWGLNTNGALGDGTTTSRTSPVTVEGGVTFDGVSAGADHSCGVTPEGTAYCWGSGALLGTGTSMQSSVPVRVMQ